MPDVVPLLPFFALGAGMGALTSWMEQHVVGAQGAEWDFSVADRVLIAGRAVWFYATKLIWPHPLIFMYPRWGIQDHAAWQYAFPVAALGVVGALWGLRHRIGRGPLVAALFFGGTLVPALGFVNVLPMRYSFVADHFQYLASLGVLILIAAGIAIYARRAAATITTAVCLALAIVSWSHAHDFGNIETLWKNTMAKNPRSWMVHNNYGVLLLERGEVDAAASSFIESIRLNPNHDQARLNLGMIAEQRGRLDEARAWYVDALRVQPVFPDAYYNLGRLSTKQGRPDEAIGHYRKAIEQDPKHDMAHVNLGMLYADGGDAARAAEHYRRALEINPDDFLAHINLGNLYLGAGQFDEALAEWAKAAAIQPRNPMVPNNIGIVQLRRGNLDDAERRFREALAIRPDYVEALTNLGTARAQRGDVAGARQYLTRALALDPGNALAKKQLDALPGSPNR
jgi:Flp pilus assembly protein TadD